MKDHFEWIGEFINVTHNNGVDSFRDLQLMSMCKYQVIANSSFSTWRGYLNRLDGKIICYPNVYSEGTMNIEKCGKGWIRIDT